MTNLVIKNMLGVAMELTDKQYKPSMESAARAVALWVASNPDYRLNRPVCYNGHLDRYTAVVELVCKEHVVILWHADGSSTRTAYPSAMLSRALDHYTNLVADGKRATLTNNEV